MVLEVAEGRITQKTYQRRLQIYVQYLKTQQSKEKETAVPHSIQCIEGGCNVVSIANHLFQNCASFEEKSTCPFGCPARVKYLPSITITESEISMPVSRVLKDHLILPGGKCLNGDCDGIENNEIPKIGEYFNICSRHLTH